ncbi:potassium channel family protein [Pseudobacteroides cellulosolvens]|uniref:Trk system potassium uptake protein TrkA n=1 Tax=Pseudobacteroides cellulosolvens ATCC 35603 = DSM 2933 TaxID=398512 RepID=A0A0L6JHB6_9FIRM|nr:NAD-binding protein [Pseudobacteroides cellulosolvens]KNY25119.1 TrkA-N domain protein [Pseudobacteroides cellulosolvens ATCC 35603 = DSM 2933]
MFIVIVGGGKVGYYLIKSLIPHNHKIVVFDPVAEICHKIANELNIPVINGDGTDIDKLTKIGLSDADIFIAVTGKDEDNLIACQLAKKNFGVKRTIARVNNPKNITVFERLGVDIAVSSTSIITDLIEQEVDDSGIKTIMKLKKGKIVLTEIDVRSTHAICDKLLKDIQLPRDCILISIIRDDEIIIPNGYTMIKSGDCIIAATSKEKQQELKEYFLKSRKL